MGEEPAGGGGVTRRNANKIAKKRRIPSKDPASRQRRDDLSTVKRTEARVHLVVAHRRRRVLVEGRTRIVDAFEMRFSHTVS